MPRYFFHVDDHPSSPDSVGTVLKDIRAARCEALHYAAELLSNLDPRSVNRTDPFCVRVLDENDNEVVVLEIHDKAVDHAGS